MDKLLFALLSNNKTHAHSLQNWENIHLHVLPASVSAAGPPERTGPPARGRWSGSRRHRTVAPRRAAAGFAGRRAPSLAGSY